MKNFINKFIISLGLIVTGMSILPATTLAAENQDCNKFGAKCHVEDINTIHTKDAGPNANLLTTIKNAINRCLGILATVVLCFCLYGGFKMLTSGSDSKGYDDGWKVLKNALIGLAIILLAWMIVSVIFRFVATLSGGNQTASENIKELTN